ncbi:TonB-dependent receptor [Flavobacteriaceae bacterium]|nr:TonB-dependent receptor [Flavobacteriaceae bacterium]MDB3863044.1 TonB-dependent receptor [Flavobacteriaceae bacterium]MDC3354128.1 TonB-dependent receptor [Flavobacteriaceae bacterium]
MNKKLTALLLLLTGFLSAQNTGSLSGRILDAQSQLPLEGATVILIGTSLGVVTNQDGYFTIEDIPTQSYNVEASYLGFESLTLFNVIVKSVGNIPLLFKLNEIAENLDEIVLVQSPFKTSSETPLSTQTFSAVEIETYPGGNNDITKVVQSMPGISPSIGGFRNDIIIRGGAPNETVYYLDGIEIPNINHFSTQGSAGGPVGMVNVSFIREVTLSSSSFGAEYDNPLSGVLAFEQREGDVNKFGGNFRLGASETALTLEGPLFRKNKEQAAKTTFLFSVRRSYLQFLFELIGLPIRPDYWDYQWKIKHEIDAYNSLTFIGIGSVDDFSVKAPDEFDEEQQATLEQVPIIDQRSTTVGLSWKRNYKNGKGFMNTVVSTNRLQNVFARYEDNTTKTGTLFQNDSYEWETKLRFQATQFTDKWKWSAGFNIQNSDYQNNTLFVYDNLSYNTDLNFIKYGLFVKASRSFLNDRLDFSWGIRTDADRFSTGSSLLDNISPRAAVSYALTENNQWKFNASLGRYFKIPTYTMLGFQNQSGIFLNQQAEYTQSDHLVGGVEYNLTPASRFTIEGFLKKYSKYPVSVIDGVSLANKGGGFEVLGNEAIVSEGEGQSSGVEVLFQQKLSKNFYGVFAYTYFSSEFTGTDGILRPSVWDSRHLISFSGGYKLKRNWELSARWRFAGKNPYVPINLEESTERYPELILDYNRLGEVKLNSFNLADIRIDKKWNFKSLSFNFYFEVQNFLAQPNPTPPEYGLNKNMDGTIINPRSLKELSTTDGNSSPLPSFGFVLYF